jgi:hypothetical protein
MRVRKVVSAVAMIMVAAVMAAGMTGCERGKHEGQPVALDLHASLPACQASPATDCYSADQLDSWLARAGGAVWRRYFSGLPPRVIYLRTNQYYSAGCSASLPNGIADSWTYTVCDNVFYLGQEVLWQEYHRFGELAALVLLADAFDMVGKVPSAPTTLQADCRAGVIGADLQRLRSISARQWTADADVLQDYADHLYSSPGGVPVDDRRAAFLKGFNTSLRDGVKQALATCKRG